MKEPNAKETLLQLHGGCIAGWIIGIKLKADTFAYQLFAVAVADQDEAYQLLHNALTTRTNSEIMEVAGPISEQTVAQLKLAEGEYRVLS